MAATSWPLAIPTGLVATTVALLRMDRREERIYAAVVGTGATAWGTAAWALSPFHDWLLIPMLGATLMAAVPWWWHHRIRSNVELRTPSLQELSADGPRPLRLPLRLWRWHRERRRARKLLSRYRRRWPELAGMGHLYGSHITGLERREEETVLHVELGPGQLARDLGMIAERIASALSHWDLMPATLHIEEGERPHQALIRLPHAQPDTDPLARVLPWPGCTNTSVSQPIPLGRFADGEEVLVPLADHFLIAGQTRWGKSGILNVILATLSHCEDAELWVIDPKGGAELGPWHPVIAHLATNGEEAQALLQAANQEMDRRYRLLHQRGLRLWAPRPGEPMLVIVIDEAAQLTSDSKRLLDRLVSVGGAAGLRCIVTTQRPSAAKMGGNRDLTSQLGTQISVHLRHARDNDMVFGDGAAGEGWRADRLRHKGAFLIRSESAGYVEPSRQARAYWLSDEMVRATVSALTERRPISAPDGASTPGGEEPDRVMRLPTVPSTTTPEPLPDRPLLHVLGAEDDGPARDRVLEALRSAYPSVLRVNELTERAGCSLATVYAALAVLKAEGKARKVRRAVWQAAPPSSSSSSSEAREC
jgi:S-DNA-T family DNA segregation ATPase FtsK/SpoIIIE